MGTAAVEKVIALRDGRLLLTGFKNKVSGREMMPGRLSGDELRRTGCRRCAEMAPGSSRYSARRR